MLHVIAKDLAAGTAADTVKLAQKMHYRVGDEKGTEYIHQHVRDRQRCKRHKVLTGSSMFAAMLESGVLQSR